MLATAAGLGALLTMLGVGAVLLALVAAGLADFGTFFQQVRGVRRAAGHEAGSQGAHVGAVAVQQDAPGHHFYVFLLKAGSGAVLAGGDTGVKGVEQGLILGGHNNSWLGMKKRYCIYSGPNEDVA